MRSPTIAAAKASDRGVPRGLSRETSSGARATAARARTRIFPGSRVSTGKAEERAPPRTGNGRRSAARPGRRHPRKRRRGSLGPPYSPRALHGPAAPRDRLYPDPGCGRADAGNHRPPRSTRHGDRAGGVLAHELFHHLARTVGAPAAVRPEVDVLRLGTWARRAVVRAAEEIAAAGFAAAWCGVDRAPEPLDCLTLAAYGGFTEPPVGVACPATS